MAAKSAATNESLSLIYYDQIKKSKNRSSSSQMTASTKHLYLPTASICFQRTSFWFFVEKKIKKEQF